MTLGGNSLMRDSGSGKIAAAEAPPETSSVNAKLPEPANPALVGLEENPGLFLLDRLTAAQQTKRTSGNFRKSCNSDGGRYWVRTNDFHRVKVTLYR